MTVTVTSPPVVVVSPTGVQGPRGNTVLAGAGMPASTAGIDGDWYIDNTTPAALLIYGPKTAGAWGTGQPIGGSGGGGGTPTGPAGGDLSGTYPNPGVAKVNGVAVSGTPGAGQVPTASSGSAASWQTPAIPRLDQVGAPAADVPMGGHKLTSLGNGTAASDAAAFGQIPVAGTAAGNYAAGNDGRLSDSRTPSGSASGDLSGSYPGPTVAKINGVAVTGTPSAGQVPTATSGTAATWQTPSGGGGPSIRTATARVTDDNLSGLPSAPTWVIVQTSAATKLQCTIPAAVGDRITVHGRYMRAGSHFLDWVLLDNTGAIALYAASGTSSPLPEGDPALYPSLSFSYEPGPPMFTIAAGHINGGNITVALAHQGTGSGLVYAHAIYPWKLRLENIGPEPA